MSESVKYYPIGLFQSNDKVGMVYPIVKINDKPTYIGGISTFNDCRGENLALNLMKQENFVIWAIDPWTSQINVEIQ